MHLSQKQKNIYRFFLEFLKSTSTFKHFQKKMSLIGYALLKLQTPKDVDK